MENKKIVFLTLLVVFTFGVVAGAFSMYGNVRNMVYYASNKDSSQEDSEALKDLDPRNTLVSVVLALDRNYVEKIDEKYNNDMSVDMIRGMLRDLGDQNSRYVDKNEMAALVNAEKGIFDGTGIRPLIKRVDVDGIEEEKLYVGAVIPNTPADLIGLKAGDLIESVNEKNILPYNPFARIEASIKEFSKKPDDSKIKEMQKFIDEEYAKIDKGIPILEAEKLILSNEKEPVKLRVNGKNFNIITKTTNVNSVYTKWLYSEIPYIRVNYLNNNTGDEISKNLIEFKKSGKDSIILDMRDVFGGTYESASNVAKYFVPNTSLGILKKRNENLDLVVPNEKNIWTGKVVVLVNKGTAKYAELIVNSLINDKKAIVVGEPTEGDLTDISIFPLENGGGYTLTTGQYVTKNSIEKVTPQVSYTFPRYRMLLNKQVILDAINKI